MANIVLISAKCSFNVRPLFRQIMPTVALMALAALHDWGEVGERPGDEGMKVGKQTLAYWGEGVFDARGDFGV